MDAPKHHRDGQLTENDDPAVGSPCRAAWDITRRGEPTTLLVATAQGIRIVQPEREALTGPNTYHLAAACPGVI